MRLQSLAWLNVEIAWALLVCGVLLVYLELCRPGAVIPGVLGGVCALTALAKLSTLPFHPIVLALAVAAVCAAAAETWYGSWGLLGGALLAASAMTGGVRWWLAGPLAVMWAVLTATLGNAAIRAHLAKRAH